MECGDCVDKTGIFPQRSYATDTPHAYSFCAHAPHVQRLKVQRVFDTVPMQ